MPISRRDFLEVSALSASSLLLTELPTWMNAEGAVIARPQSLRRLLSLRLEIPMLLRKTWNGNPQPCRTRSDWSRWM